MCEKPNKEYVVYKIKKNYSDASKILLYFEINQEEAEILVSQLSCSSPEFDFYSEPAVKHEFILSLN